MTFDPDQTTSYRAFRSAQPFGCICRILKFNKKLVKSILRSLTSKKYDPLGKNRSVASFARPIFVQIQSHLSVTMPSKAVNLIAVMIFAGHFIPAEAETLNAHGKLYYRVITPSGEVYSQIAKKFDLTAENKKWLITMRDVKEETFRKTSSKNIKITTFKTKKTTFTNHLDRIEIGYDGTNLFQKGIYDFDREADRIKRQTKAHYAGYASELVKIARGNVPGWNSSMYFPVWLTFLSDKYFLEHQGREIPPLTMMREEIETPPLDCLTFSYNSQISRLWNFPKEVVFNSNGMMEKNDTFESTKKTEQALQQLQPPFEHGFKQAIYSVTEWVSNTVVYPKKSILEIYYPKNSINKSPEDVQLNLTVEVDTESLLFETNSAAISLSVNTNTLTKIADSRVVTPNGNPISYLTRKSIIDTKSREMQLKINRQYNRDEDNRRISTKSLYKNSVIVTLLVLTVIIIFTLFKTNHKT